MFNIIHRCLFLLHIVNIGYDAGGDKKFETRDKKQISVLMTEFSQGLKNLIVEWHGFCINYIK
jgi:hypothetical protein